MKREGERKEGESGEEEARVQSQPKTREDSLARSHDLRRFLHQSRRQKERVSDDKGETQSEGSVSSSFFRPRKRGKKGRREGRKSARSPRDGARDQLDVDGVIRGTLVRRQGTARTRECGGSEEGKKTIRKGRRERWELGGRQGRVSHRLPKMQESKENPREDGGRFILAALRSFRPLLPRFPPPPLPYSLAMSTALWDGSNVLATVGRSAGWLQSNTPHPSIPFSIFAIAHAVRVACVYRGISKAGGYDGQLGSASFHLPPRSPSQLSCRNPTSRCAVRRPR